MNQLRRLAIATKPAIALALLSSYIERNGLQPLRYVVWGKKSLPAEHNTKQFQHHWLWRRLRYLYCRLVRLKGHPDAIARGLAAGVFAGCFPIFGFQMIAGVVLGAILRGNIPLALAGTWISNPATYIPIFVFNFRIGNWILGAGNASFSVVQSIQELRKLNTGFTLTPLLQELANLGASFAVPMFVGSAVVGLFCAVSSYVFSAWLVRYVRHQRHLQRIGHRSS